MSPSPNQQSIDPKLQAAIDDSLDRLRSEFEQRLAEAKERFRDLAGGEPAPVGDSPALIHLMESVVAIDVGDSQAEILSALLEGTANFASRAALFLLRDEAIQGWASYGFDATAPPIEEARPGAPDEAPWSELASGRGVLHLSADDARHLCHRLGLEPGAEAVLIPFVLRDRVAAGLFADRLADDAPVNLPALQLLTHLGAQSLETLPLRERRGTATLRVAAAAAIAPPPVDELTAVADEISAAPPSPEPQVEPAAPVADAQPEPIYELPDLDIPIEEVPAEEGPVEEPAVVPSVETFEPETSTFDIPTLDAPALETPAAETPSPEVSGREVSSPEVAVTEPAGLGAEPPASAPVTLEEETPEWLKTLEAGLTAPLKPPVEAIPADSLPAEAPTPEEPAAAEPQAPAGFAPTETVTAEQIGFQVEPVAQEPAPLEATPPMLAPEPVPQEPAPAAPPPVIDDAVPIEIPAPEPEPVLPAAPSEEEPAPPAGETGSGTMVAPPDDLDGPGWAFTTSQIPSGAGDDALHEEARRLARLLVTEIKLYNEEEVEEGRRQQDIYARLREDIDRSRQIYDERIEGEVRGSADYFREEMVRILAGGDAAALGQD